MSLDIRKKQVLDLKKSVGLDGKTVQVVVALDYSGSMSSLYRNGSVQELLERLLPLALGFDDDGKMPFYLFSNGSEQLPDVTENNYPGYVRRETDRSSFEMCGTEYAPVLRKIESQYSKSGFLGLGSAKKDPVFVIFVTDGDNSDHRETESVIRDLSHKNVFVQFVGIGSERFSFLERLDTLSGRKVDNAGFMRVRDVRSKSDGDLYGELIHELPTWMEEAKKLSLIA